MVIDYEGNGSPLFQSLDPTDLNLYTWGQTTNTQGFIPVSNLVIGNSSGQVNVVGNVNIMTTNQWNLSVGGNTMNFTVAKAPTLTILTTPNNNASQTGTYIPPAGATWLRVRMVGGGSGGAAWDGSTNYPTGGTNTVFGNMASIGITCNGSSNAFSVASGRGGIVNAVGVGPANGWIILLSANGVAGEGTFSPDANGYALGGCGASTPLGGGGGGGGHQQGGWAAWPGSGAGGGGAGGEPSVAGGGGGGCGGYCEFLINQIAASYPYTIGAGGEAWPPNPPLGGQNGGQGEESLGGDGGSGSIIIEEHYGM